MKMDAAWHKGGSSLGHVKRNKRESARSIRKAAVVTLLIGALLLASGIKDVVFPFDEGRLVEAEGTIERFYRVRFRGSSSTYMTIAGEEDNRFQISQGELHKKGPVDYAAMEGAKARFLYGPKWLWFDCHVYAFAAGGTEYYGPEDVRRSIISSGKGLIVVGVLILAAGALMLRSAMKWLRKLNTPRPRKTEKRKHQMQRGIDVGKEE